MNTLHDRLAELADDAPTGGAPPAELWARGNRAHRLRAAGLAATLLVVGAVGTGIGVRLADGDRSDSAPAGTVGISLPIEYPVGEELPDLGDTPGPLAAIWVDRVGGGAPELVGLVAETGTFGTLAIDVSYSLGVGGQDGDFVHDMEVELSPDGRRIAYLAAVGELVVRDLVSGESYSPAFQHKPRPGFGWVDATHLLGHDARGTDVDAWLWEPGATPKLVNPYIVTYGESDLAIPIKGDRLSCEYSPVLQNLQVAQELWAGTIQVSELCNVMGVIGSGILLGHWNSDRLPDGVEGPTDDNLTVVALDIRGTEFPAQPYQAQTSPPRFDDPALRRVVITAAAPREVSLASDLIGAALEADGGAS